VFLTTLLAACRTLLAACRLVDSCLLTTRSSSGTENCEKKNEPDEGLGLGQGGLPQEVI
jgi:hypothetical protein